MKKLMLFLALLCLTGLALAAPTDGNYTLTQHNLTGGGEVGSDTNFVSFASAGEPPVVQNSSDGNSALAAGFWGTPFSARLIEVVEEVVEDLARTIFVVMGDNGYGLIPFIAIVMLAGFGLFYMLFKKKMIGGKEEKENG